MNKKVSGLILLALLVIALAAILYAIYLETHQVQIKKDSRLAALLPLQEQPLHLDPQTKTQDCQLNGPLPDRGCSPGAVFLDATKEEICVQGYTKTVRSVSAGTKKKVFAEYDIPYPQPYGSYEVDHLVPLALGGSNEIANLFPESAEPYPGFKEKDVVENFLHEEVCQGRISLSAAQKQIAENWVLIYTNLSEGKVLELKSKYRSWAN